MALACLMIGAEASSIKAWAWERRVTKVAAVHMTAVAIARLQQQPQRQQHKQRRWLGNTAAQNTPTNATIETLRMYSSPYHMCHLPMRSTGEGAQLKLARTFEKCSQKEHGLALLAQPGALDTHDDPDLLGLRSRAPGTAEHLVLHDLVPTIPAELRQLSAMTTVRPVLIQLRVFRVFRVSAVQPLLLAVCYVGIALGLVPEMSFQGFLIHKLVFLTPLILRGGVPGVVLLLQPVEIDADVQLLGRHLPNIRR